jgi:cyclopropane fatty-acyl-phospholipid synthase-like methyltransferase
MTVEEFEKKKYTDLWRLVNYTSLSANNFAEFVKSIVPSGDTSVLEIGCGDGTTFKALNNHCNVFGNDITIESAIKNRINSLRLYEYPVWNIPEYLSFNYTISTDVLEHLPLEKVDESIKKIIEITELGTIHAICTRPASTKYEGHQVHLTVRPIWWWRKMFERYNTKKIKLIIIDTKEL